MLVTILESFYWVFYVYEYFILLSVIFSWFPNIYNYKIPRIIGNIGEWYLKPFLGKVIVGPLDLTPIIGFMIYGGALNALSRLLMIL